MELELVWDAQAETGEGPIWWKDRLYWVDIPAGKLHTYLPETEERLTTTLAHQIGTVVPRASGGLVLALDNGFALFDPITNKLTPLPNPPAEVLAGRFNDGKCDPRGRFWAGTMAQIDGVGRGSLYRLDTDFQCHEMLTGIGCSNGIAWSLDETRMYYIDTNKNNVMEFPYQVETGAIAGGRVLISKQLDRSEGAFDGMTMDDLGRLWIGLWQGCSVVCYDPDRDEIVDVIEVPAKNVTACWFGGDDLQDLYITTATEDMTEEDRRTYPHAGGLFRCRPGATGLPAVPFAG